jgi:hypothetical protein
VTGVDPQRDAKLTGNRFARRFAARLIEATGS